MRALIETLYVLAGISTFAITFIIVLKIALSIIRYINRDNDTDV